MNCGCLKPTTGQQSAVNFSCENAGRDVEFVDLELFLPRVTLVAKGVPDDVAIEYLRQACQQLARDSWLLKREVSLDVQAGVKDYYLHCGDNEQVHYVDNISLGKCKQGYFRYKPLARYRDENIAFEPSDKILLTHLPQQDRERHLFVHYFAIPTQNACQVDKLIYDRYHDVVVNGALADLLLMRQYEFADPQMAMVYEKRFKQGIAQAKIDTMRDFSTDTQSLIGEAWI
ncbi:hypothetical protein ACLSYV_03560 [Avibacterium avium]|uniref:hypothetical protein n=1 Tax=Avibacterium TaxID=292486 RepID=UPI0039FC66CD